MQEKKKKVIKMIDELIRYFFDNNCKNVGINYYEQKDKYVIEANSEIDISEEKIQDLCDNFSVHRYKEYDFFWDLIGETSGEEELELLFILADDIRIYYENNILKFVIDVLK